MERPSNCHALPLNSPAPSLPVLSAGELAEEEGAGNQRGPWGSPEKRQVVTGQEPRAQSTTGSHTLIV